MVALSITYDADGIKVSVDGVENPNINSVLITINESTQTAALVYANVGLDMYLVDSITITGSAVPPTVVVPTPPNTQDTAHLASQAKNAEEIKAFDKNVKPAK